MTETRTMLAELPDPNKLVAFDRNRHIMVTMAENVERATRPQLADLVQLLVERSPGQGQDRGPRVHRVDASRLARSSSQLRCYGAPGRTRTADAAP